MQSWNSETQQTEENIKGSYMPEAILTLSKYRLFLGG